MRRNVASAARGLLAVASASVALACSNSERAPFLAPDTTFDASVQDAPTQTFDVGAADTSINCSSGAEAGICACKEIGQKPTSLYVVLDRSGSMADKIDSTSTQTKWDTIVLALLAMKTGALRALGSRVAVGLALFPGDGSDSCSTGGASLPLTLGSQKTYDTMGAFLTGVSPRGGTPTSATLTALAPTIKALPRPAYVLLATDGAPNCADTPCDIPHCGYNVEHAMISGGGFCDDTINCCDPKQVAGGDGWRACIDSSATQAAVADLAAAGVKVFVLGIPGALGPYGADLDALATAGGTAREDAKPGEPLYYSATTATTEALTAALKSVAAKVVDTCLITLESPPSDPGITNVVIDGALVPQDPVNGWAWGADGSTIELRGATCDRVKNGEVTNVQVAVGCKTVTR